MSYGDLHADLIALEERARTDPKARRDLEVIERQILKAERKLMLAARADTQLRSLVLSNASGA